MLRKTSTCALLFCLAAPVCIGGASTAFGGSFWGRTTRTASGSGCGKCAHKHDKCSNKCGDKCGKVARASMDRPRAVADLPPNAVEGECYAKVFVPPQYETRTERTLIKEASETIEIIPAELKEVEERVMVKECIRQLEQVPAEYRTQERVVQVKPGYSGWVLEKTARCVAQGANGDKQELRDVYCFVSTPPVTKTIQTQCLVKPACVREVVIPAQYETIRKQVVVCPAKTKKICTAAEYEDIEKTVMVSDGMMKWERVICERNASADTFNKVKVALNAAGYKTSPADGQLTPVDWTALTQFQQKNGLGVGELTHETLNKLGIQTQ